MTERLTWQEIQTQYPDQWVGLIEVKYLNDEKIEVSKNNPKYDSRDDCNAIIETETNTLIFGCKNIVMPDRVTSIGDDAFQGCADLVSIAIPDGVASIGDDAFQGCASLTSITISDDVTSIGSGAFSGCSSLETIEVTKNNSKYDSRDDCNAIIETDTNTLIFGCKNTKIPDSVTSIDFRAFVACSSLETVKVSKSNSKYDSRGNCNAIIETETNTLIFGCKNTRIPDSVTSIGEYAFSECSSLQSIKIPDSVTSIGKYAFGECGSLKSIKIPDSVTSIGELAFNECSSLQSIKISDCVTSIGDVAFAECSSLKSIKIPDSVTSIGFGAFRNCSSLKSVKIPDTVMSIGYSAFYNCSSLTSITIPDSVTSIERDAFYDIPVVYYNVTASGRPWGAKSVEKH